jgi:hypothetical protein
MRGFFATWEISLAVQQYGDVLDRVAIIDRVISELYITRHHEKITAIVWGVMVQNFKFPRLFHIAFYAITAEASKPLYS